MRRIRSGFKGASTGNNDFAGLEIDVDKIGQRSPNCLRGEFGGRGKQACVNWTMPSHKLLDHLISVHLKARGFWRRPL